MSGQRQLVFAAAFGGQPGGGHLSQLLGVGRVVPRDGQPLPAGGGNAVPQIGACWSGQVERRQIDHRLVGDRADGKPAAPVRDWVVDGEQRRAQPALGEHLQVLGAGLLGQRRRRHHIPDGHRPASAAGVAGRRVPAGQLHDGQPGRGQKRGQTGAPMPAGEPRVTVPQRGPALLRSTRGR